MNRHIAQKPAHQLLLRFKGIPADTTGKIQLFPQPAADARETLFTFLPYLRQPCFFRHNREQVFPYLRRKRHVLRDMPCFHIPQEPLPVFLEILHQKQQVIQKDALYGIQVRLRKGKPQLHIANVTDSLCKEQLFPANVFLAVCFVLLPEMGKIRTGKQGFPVFLVNPEYAGMQVLFPLHALLLCKGCFIDHIPALFQRARCQRHIFLHAAAAGSQQEIFDIVCRQDVFFALFHTLDAFRIIRVIRQGQAAVFPEVLQPPEAMLLSVFCFLIIL